MTIMKEPTNWLQTYETTKLAAPFKEGAKEAS